MPLPAPTASDIRPVRVTSPRVESLRALLATAGFKERTALVESFWSEVRRSGTPLVEEVDGDPDHRVVTFLWRGHRATRQVLLVGNRIIDRSCLAGGLMERVPGSDVWHLGLRLRADHRGSYRIAAHLSSREPPTDPVEHQEQLRALMVHAAHDPLNRRPMPTRWHPLPSSVFSLPAAPAQPWQARRGSAPAGRVERHPVPGGALDGDRDTWVYLPPGHRPEGSGRLPVLVLCDGDMWFGRLGFGETLDALIADGTLPPLAVLAPDAVDRATRWRDLGARDHFTAFLADDLLPWAEDRWPLSADPRHTVVAGQSLGAVAALHAAHRRPGRFGAVIAQSASLWWRPGLPARPAGPAPGVPWLTARYAAGGPRHVSVHLDVGLHEGRMVEDSRELYDTLRAAGHPVTYREFNGGHDYACWHGALADALVRLLGADSPPP